MGVHPFESQSENVTSVSHWRYVTLAPDPASSVAGAFVEAGSAGAVEQAAETLTVVVAVAVAVAVEVVNAVLVKVVVTRTGVRIGAFVDFRTKGGRVTRACSDVGEALLDEDAAGEDGARVEAEVFVTVGTGRHTRGEDEEEEWDGRGEEERAGVPDACEGETAAVRSLNGIREDCTVAGGRSGTGGTKEEEGRGTE
jgi:hypothetical protein